MSNPDALLVLGGGIQAPNTLTLDSEARVKKAAELFHQGGVEQIVFSGDASWQINNEGANEAELMRQLAKEVYEVPAGCTDLETEAKTTIGNLALSAGLLDGAERIGIVSQAYHEKRCLLIARFALPKQEVEFVEAEAREPHNMWAERASLLISKAILHGVEPGDIETILARNDAYIRNASALRNLQGQLRSALMNTTSRQAA